MESLHWHPWNREMTVSSKGTQRGRNHRRQNHSPRRILAIDIGGSHVKFLVSGETLPRRFASGPELTAIKMVDAVKHLAKEWKYDVISLGYPGPVGSFGPLSEPGNLAPGWVGFDFAAAFERPVRILNDAAMQAVGSYEGGRMLFLGLGTGLGSALISHDAILSLELGCLPHPAGRTYAHVLGRKGLKQNGKKVWRREVIKASEAFLQAFGADYVVLGGGNSKVMRLLPPGARLGHNQTAFRGGFRLWETDGISTLDSSSTLDSVSDVNSKLPAVADWRML